MTNPQHHHRNSGSLGRRLACALLAVSLVVPGSPGMAQQSIQLPDMGSTGEVLPPDQERAFPREFERVMRSQGALIDDPIINTYFVDMGYRLVMHSDYRDRDFHFHVLRIPGINAFAAPAGVVALNAGLILAADSADEVAGVVAHEISHVTQNHLSRGMEEAQNVSLPVMLATLGLVLAGGLAGGMSGDATQGILATGLGLSQQSQINYTRQNEAEADRIGIQLMSRAGYDPIGMADFFNTLNRASRAMGGGPPEYLRTHPLTVSRVAEARQRAESMRASQSVADERFAFIQARLRVLMARHSNEAADHFTARLENEIGDETANRYGLALAHIRGSRFDPADAQIRWLLEREPDNQLFRLAEAELLLDRNELERALVAFESLYDGYGQSQVVSVPYARALLQTESTEDAQEAAEILSRELRRRPNDLAVSELLARAADQAGDPVRAAEVVAENYYQRGGLPEAIEQLERILERDTLNYYQRARVSARLDQLRGERARGIRLGTSE